MLYGGLDVGSSNVKFAIYDLTGRLMALTFRKYKPAGAPFRFCMENVWEAVKEVMSEASRKVPQISRLKGIAISVCGEIAVPVDERGNQLCEGFIGSAPQGEKEMEKILQRISSEEIYRITGLMHDRKYTAARLMWYGSHLDELPSKYLFVEDFLVNRLTGIAVVSISTASRSMLLDIRQGNWSERMMRIVDMTPSEVSSPVPSGTYIGTIKPEVAFDIGFPGGVKVFAGGHDQLCCAIGSGAIQGQTAFNCSGTFECIGIPVNREPDAETYAGKMQIVPFFDETMRMAFWSPVAGTAALDWFAHSYLATTRGKQDMTAIHTCLQKKCTSLPSPVICLPYFTGRNYPDRAPNVRASFHGIDLYTTPEAIYQAIMEGITFELRECLQRFQELGYAPQRIRLSGGGSKSEYWSQMRADILNLPIEQVLQSEPGTLGSMMIAAVGDGRFASIQEAVSTCVSVQKTFEPIAQNQQRYEEQRQRYLTLRNAETKGS